MKIRAINIPNLITLIRLILVPFIGYLILRQNTSLAVTLFVVAALSDKFDGELARKLKKTTYWGGWFDAFTDSLLIFTTLFFTYITGRVNLLLLIILFLPKIINYLLLQLLYEGKYKPTIFSRWSSVIFYMLIPLFLMNIHQIVDYLLILVIYLLSLIHWIRLITNK